MISGFIKFLSKAFVDLLKIYLLILSYPFSLLKHMYLKNNAYFRIKLYITRWGLLPIFNIIFGFLYHFVVKPIRKHFITMVAPHLYNHSNFYKELEKADSELLDSNNNVYRYLLFNRFNDSFKFPDMNVNYDDLCTYVTYFRKLAEPGWRQHYIHFYHTDYTHYRPKMYEDAMRLYRRKAAEAKHLESLDICIKNLLLLYRYMFNQLIDQSYEITCYIRYYLKKNYPKYYKLADYLFNYSKIYTFLKLIVHLNFSWLLVLGLGDKVSKFYFEVQSLGEVGTERSIYYSKKFGFAGNLYLQFGYFLKEWDIHLEKDMDYSNNRIFKEYKLDEPYEFMHETIGKRRLQYFLTKKARHAAKAYKPYKFTFPKELNNAHGRMKSTLIFARRKRRVHPYMYPYKHKLDFNYNFLIRKDLLSYFNKRYHFYKKLYSVFGNYTKHLVRFFGLFKIRPINRVNFKSEKVSFLSSYYNETSNVMLLFIFIITLESTFFVLHVLNH